MTIAKWCLAAAWALPILTVGLAKVASARGPREQFYDNADPREWERRQTGWKQRANAAQQNGFEVLPLFFVAVLLAQMSGVDAARVDMLALLFVALRVAYVGIYLANLAALRTAVWGAGVAVCVVLLGLAA
ncbi:MAG: MAPEG family protein [Burkholderiales bacterium]|nr:MAPEG family protein [Burkholderiales bacterium]